MTHAKKTRIALVLGGGAARGWAHIGVIHELAELGIEPDLVVGTSVGSVVGGAYASGKLAQFEEWICGLGRMDIIRLLDARMTGGGFLQGNSLMSAIGKRIGDPRIEDLAIPFACVATELGTGREVWLRDGSLLDACRASIALPGMFAPARYRGERLLLDGGLVNPVPVSLARAMGGDVVIAVNLNGDLIGRHFYAHKAEEPDSDEDHGREPVKERPDPGLLDVLASSIDIMQDRITRSRMAGEPPDIHIAPLLNHIGLMEFDRAAECIKEGREAARRRKGELLKLNHAVQRQGAQNETPARVE